jgi:hypothetical protein
MSLPYNRCKNYLQTMNLVLICTLEEFKENKNVVFRCKQQHVTTLNFDSFRNKKRNNPDKLCTECDQEIFLREKFKKLAKEIFDSTGHTLLSLEKERIVSYLCGVCNNINDSFLNNLLINKGHCPYCQNEQFKNDLQDVKNRIHKFESNYEVVTYKNNKEVTIKCGKEHTFIYSLYDIERGRKCPHCRELNSEKLCRSIFEKITGYKFNKVHPKWLNGLELDGYCEILNIAFEYQGRQHVEYVYHFHRNAEDFTKQKERDQKKRQICREREINLIEIPHKYSCKNPIEMNEYISQIITNLSFNGLNIE